jgi:predicted neuraminidase
MLKIAPGLTITTLTQPIYGLLHHAHCSSIQVFPDNEILVIFYWAGKEAGRDQAIYAIRKKHSEDKWGPVQRIYKGKGLSWVGNPTIWIAPDTGKLWMFYVSSFGGWSTCTPRYITSSDRGRTWSKSTKMYWFISRVTKNQPILTQKGWYILPMTQEFRDCIPLLWVSKDHGKTWVETGRLLVPKQYWTPDKKWGRLLDQPTIIERKDGTIFGLTRTYKPLGKMFQFESPDGGETWTDPVPSVLPNPDGGFHMIRLQSGNIAILYNHAPAPPSNNFSRNPVSVALSEDEGRTWKYRRNLCEYHDEEGEKYPKNCTFQYTTLAQGPDGQIHATWSFAHTDRVDGKEISTMDIQYTCFDENWIKERPFFDHAWEL